MKKIFSMLLIMFLSTSLFSQGRTIGTRLLDMENHPPTPGYKLMYMHSQPNVYLIDHWGEVVHVWRDTLLSPGNSAFLTEEGKLFKTASLGRNANPNFQSGGAGDFLQIRDWDNTLLWNFEYSNENVRMHHDMRPMPNGNALILAFESISRDSAIALGRDTTMLGQVLWMEHIIEVEPVGADSGNIVWEWHAVDHLIQDFDSTKANYGIVADHPGKININFDTNANPDWVHANAIDYNPYLDQILISAPGMGEVWIIDHSNTSSATADSAGDLMYRWGNPAAYDQGTPSDTKLFWQHDAHWVRDNAPDSGKIMIFNNRYGGNYSAVVLIDPPKNADSTYTLAADSTFLPVDFDSMWTATNPTDFFSSFISGSQQLSNGNLLVCKGAAGEVFEVNADSDTLWMWINPIAGGNVLMQGDSVPVNPNNGRSTNLLFRAHHYNTDFAGFTNRDLSPMGTIERTLPINVVINEFVASTDTCCQDQAGESEDFIELMNVGNNRAVLSALFFSDDMDEPTKHRIGIRNRGMGANGFIGPMRPVLWADKDLDQGRNHLDFKLSADGEFISIYQASSYWDNDPRLLVLDSLTFGVQDSDISYGRYPDGSDMWQQMIPTPGSSNYNVAEFSLLEPTDNTQIIIDENNVDTGFITFSWEDSWNFTDDEIVYHLHVSSTGIGDHDMDTTATSASVPYQEIIELMVENNVTTAYIDWTVYALDSTDTLEAENAPFSLIVNGENALSAYEEELIPAQYALHQNYPNPFNPVTTVRYDLPENSLVTITIYDMLGKEISTIVNEYQDAGYKSIVWNATNDYGQSISAGIYIYQIKTKDFVQTKKMILLK